MVYPKIMGSHVCYPEGFLTTIDLRPISEIVEPGRAVRVRVVQGSSKKHVTRNLADLICEAFHGPRPSPRHTVMHRDDDLENCAADNLSWQVFKKQPDKVEHRFDYPESIYAYF